MIERNPLPPALDARLSRRRLLRLSVVGAGALSLGGVLAACGDDDDSGSTSTGTSTHTGAGSPVATASGAARTPSPGSETGNPPSPTSGTGIGDVGTDHVVEMTNALKFVPDTLTIKVGDVVTWSNTSSVSHTSTCDPGKAADASHAQLPEGAEKWDSGLLDPGQDFQHTFEVAGEYTYFCIPHESANMIGHITVQ